MSRTRDQLEAYLKGIEVRANSVLDIGGSQLPISRRVGLFDVNDYKILDLKTPHKVEREPDYIGDINEYIVEEIEPADVVFCLEVFEYVWDPVTAIKNIFHLTKSGGVAYISFPFIYPHHNPVVEDFLRYTEYGCLRLIEHAGFEVQNIHYRTAEKAKILNFFRHEGMRAAKDYEHHDVVGFIFKVQKP